MRFSLTPRLRAAISRAKLLIDNTSDDAAAMASAERAGSIDLVDVRTLSRLLLTIGRSENEAAAEPSWVHELMLGAAPVLPAKVERAPAHPSLAPRLAVLRAAQEDREYARLVGSGLARDDDVAARDAAEMSTYRSQIGVGLNLIVSMATMFTVGAYAGGTKEEPFGVRAVICGLALMLLAMGVEMSLFLIGAMRVDAKVHKRESRAQARGVADRTQIRSVHAVRSAVAEGSASAKGTDLSSLGHAVNVT